MDATIGRKVWYWPTLQEQQVFNSQRDDLPFDATVIYVHRDGNVNLLIIDHAGHVFVREDVVNTSDDDREEGYWSWMPYQLAQAAKQKA